MFLSLKQKVRQACSLSVGRACSPFQKLPVREKFPNYPQAASLCHKLIALALLTASSALACTIPVFRYALDRWHGDEYHLIVPASSSKDAELARALLPYRGTGPANIHIEESQDAAVAESQLFLPSDRQRATPLWSGKLSPQTFSAALESPARKELLQRLLAGESVVWVIVDGGKPQDSAEVERIAKRLRFLENVVQLPPQDPNDPDSKLGPGPPLQLKLTTMHLSLQNAEEKLFCAMLAGKKAAEALAKGEPFAAAVFGRGRVLGAWPLSDLDDTAMEDITMFLTGRCSCRVKNESPGWDVLMNVDWEVALQKVQDARKNADATPEPVVALLKPEIVTVTAQPTEEPKFRGTNSALIATGSVLLVAFLGWFGWRKMRR